MKSELLLSHCCGNYPANFSLLPDWGTELRDLTAYQASTLSQSCTPNLSKLFFSVKPSILIGVAGKPSSPFGGLVLLNSLKRDNFIRVCNSPSCWEKGAGKEREAMSFVFTSEKSGMFSNFHCREGASVK